MKSKISIIPYFFILLTVTAGSCSKQLNQTPVSNVTLDNFYTTPNDFKQAVTGAYTQLKSYPTQILWLGEMRSDNLNAISDGNRDWDAINNYHKEISATTFVNNAWDNNWNGIFNVNVVLSALSQKGSIIGDDALKNRYEGELHFLRAFYYFQLLRLFGKLPVIASPLSATEVTGVERSPVASVYNFIVADLKAAAAILPDAYTEAADLGRPTLGAANALLGQVYLTKSAPAYDIEGPGLNSKQYDSAYYYFNEVTRSNKYSLVSKYPDVFSYTNENNSEVVFDIQFASGSNGAGFPSHLAPVAYWIAIGVTNSYGNGYGATSTFNITNNLKQSYRPNGVVQDVRDTFNVNYTYGVSTFFKKYIDVSRRGARGTDWPINFIAIRYADVLLSKAEAILNGASGGTTTEAIGYVNQVRNRAGLPNISGLTQAELLEERRREFAGEGLRWNDLVRSGQLVGTINNWITSDGLSSQILSVDNNTVIYPIPAKDIAASNGLYAQNPGY